MYKKYFIVFLFYLLVCENTYSQYKLFDIEVVDSCTSITEKKIADNRKAVMCSHRCNGEDSYYSEIEEINKKGYYVRSGLSVWYYDNNFSKIRRRSYFYQGEEYGTIQEFYENGTLKSEGVCKTILYKKSSKNDKIIYKIDLNDTLLISNKGIPTFDSIVSISKFAYYDSVLSEKPFEKSKYGLLISFPYSQRQKSGEWKYYDATGKLQRREYYTFGILTKTIKY